MYLDNGMLYKLDVDVDDYHNEVSNLFHLRAVLDGWNQRENRIMNF